MKADVRIAEEQFKAKLLDVGKEIITHPAVTTILGCVACELLQRVTVDVRPAEPASPGYFSWAPLSFGFHFGRAARPAEDIKLFSQGLASAIEVGLIINLAGQGIINTAEAVDKMGSIVPTLSPVTGKNALALLTAAK